MGRMLRRVVPSLALSALALAWPSRSEASGAWIAGTSLTPIEQRVAVAVGPSRTTVWTSLSFGAPPGIVGIVIPVPPGASLDVSSDAWFEALEASTAPRIFPPSNVGAWCPGLPAPPDLMHVAGDLGHQASLAIQDFAVLDDANAAVVWAVEQGLTVPQDLPADLASMPGMRFAAMRLALTTAPALSPTFRVVMPGAPAVLPLALVRADAAPLRVTTWVIAGGTAGLVSVAPASIPASSLVWSALKQTSNYQDASEDALPGALTDGLLEAASHSLFASSVVLEDGKHAVDDILSTYFDRASAYGDTAGDPSLCASAATFAMGSSMPVAESCPNAGLGVIDPAPICVESPSPATVDPSKLRCGPRVDDLAIALSGLAPQDVWITRRTMLLPPHQKGHDLGLTVTPGGKSVLPSRRAGVVDYTGCTGGVGGGGGGSGGGSSSGGMSSGGSSGSYDPDEVLETIYDVATSIDYDDASCDGSSTSAAVSDGCDSGDASGASCDGSDVDGGSCDSGSGSGSGSCDGGDDFDCGGSSGGGCDAGDADFNCSGGGSSGCSGGGGSAFDCSAAGLNGRSRRGVPKPSILLMIAIVVLAPLRRRGTARRRAERARRA